MSTGKDYLAAFRAEPGDKLDYGVKGMKWGVRKSETRLPPRSHDGGGDGKKNGTRLPPRSHEGGGKKGETRLPPRSHEIKTAEKGGVKGTELSAERYNRLREQAKLGKVHLMSDDDLKFFNARTEAMAKINKLNQSDPGWLSKTTKNVLQNTAQKVMSDISQNVANKYVTIPVTEAITKKK